ncbi:hypothetical protein SAMN05443668_13053 [Cryptosporangium aurantiacum]|uniref:Ketoreductase domain-containing protein n=1 Tax=Cryptosporangium aurantiacum TaxID=134849 RepID=A0A1M7RP65_9ACTN|nr:hypothetical protein SAMN05443668_13053 [Cryptosporangium aurantiacum]
MQEHVTGVSRRDVLRTVVAGAGGTALTAAVSGSTAAATPAGHRRFEGKVVVITGATSGIGRATAEAFAREGAHVIFCGRRAALGRQVQAAIRGTGGSATFVPADVRFPDQVQRLVDTAVARHGRLDIAFNNAGVLGARKPVQDTTDAEFDELIDINLRGVFNAMRAELRQFRRQQGAPGVIVNTSSFHAYAARALSPVYGATKGAILAMTRSAAIVQGEDRTGIRINVLAPGTVDTRLLRQATGGDPAATARAAQDASGLRRIATPAEMAGVVLFLASDDAVYITGEGIAADGGALASI